MTTSDRNSPGADASQQAPASSAPSTDPTASAQGSAERLRIEPGRCIRCAAAVAIAPELFVLEARGNRVFKQPTTQREHSLARSASLVCPMRAIHYDEAGEP